MHERGCNADSRKAHLKGFFYDCHSLNAVRHCDVGGDALGVCSFFSGWFVSLGCVIY
jgi:hypothetical protein